MNFFIFWHRTTKKWMRIDMGILKEFYNNLRISIVRIVLVKVYLVTVIIPWKASYIVPAIERRLPTLVLVYGWKFPPFINKKNFFELRFLGRRFTSKSFLSFINTTNTTIHFKLFKGVYFEKKVNFNKKLIFKMKIDFLIVFSNYVLEQTFYPTLIEFIFFLKKRNILILFRSIKGFSLVCFFLN